MGAHSPDYEVIVCPPDESFRWNVHGYPHHLAKWHYHPEYELHLILETSGRMMIGDYIGPFEPGTLILTGPNLPHNWVSEIGPDDRVSQRDMLIQFTPEFGGAIGSTFAEFKAVRTMLDESVFGIAFTGVARADGVRRLRDIGGSTGARRLFLFLELMDMLGRATHERQILSRSSPAAGVHTAQSTKLQTAISHIYAHYTQDVSLNAVADLVKMEPSTFSRFFKKQTGHAFSRFVNQLRVHFACGQLARSDLSVTQICFNSGFNNTANFNRQFAAICRETPSDYRRSAQRLAKRAPGAGGPSRRH